MTIQQLNAFLEKITCSIETKGTRTWGRRWASGLEHHAVRIREAVGYCDRNRDTARVRAAVERSVRVATRSRPSTKRTPEQAPASPAARVVVPSAPLKPAAMYCGICDAVWLVARAECPRCGGLLTARA